MVELYTIPKTFMEVLARTIGAPCKLLLRKKLCNRNCDGAVTAQTKFKSATGNFRLTAIVRSRQKDQPEQVALLRSMV